MLQYVVTGNVMIDNVYFSDGTVNKNQLGGPSVFAYTGVSLWTDDALLVCNVGRDFYDYFDDWVRQNEICTSGIVIKADHCNTCHLEYYEDGTYGDRGLITGDRFWENLGSLKTTPEDIEKFTMDGNVKGIYIAQNCDSVFWNKLGEMKQRDKFKIMWEIEAPFATKKYMDKILHALTFTDIFSINLQEAQKLTEAESEEKIIEQLKQLPVDMILFRVGERGLYTIHTGESYFHPSVKVDKVIDPTGCGNTSTGAALYAYCEYRDPIKVGIMANVAAAMNLRQYGVIPDTKVLRSDALEQVERLYKNYLHKI
ncbi:carbohydrate kinase family protein [Bacillus sp. JJ1562]|uniref:carbohydrate kinase family protein n=1 Tax=Bacillus sp. JJ1562 TaxID=3122960 RepID=UPI003001EA67